MRLWSPKSGKCRFVFKDKRCAGWHPSDQHAILTLACSDDSSLVLTGSDDGTSRLASIVPKKERVVATLQHRREGALAGHSVESVDFSHNGTSLCLTAGSAGLLRIWDVNTQQMRTECRHDAGIIRAKFLPDQPLILSCSVDQSVRLWDARSGKEERKWTGHTDWFCNADSMWKCALLQR